MCKHPQWTQCVNQHILPEYTIFMHTQTYIWIESGTNSTYIDAFICPYMYVLHTQFHIHMLHVTNLRMKFIAHINDLIHYVGVASFCDSTPTQTLKKSWIRYFKICSYFQMKPNLPQ